MNEVQRAEMKDTINQMVQEGRFQNKKVTIFGSNQPAEEIVTYLSEHNISVEFVIDNNLNKVGTLFYGTPVNLPEEALGDFQENAIILIASKHYQAMKQQLERMNYIEHKHIVSVVQMNTSSCFSVTRETFDKKCEAIIEGTKLLELLYAEEQAEMIFLCPFRALGDIYIAGLFFNEYLQKHKIQNYLFVVIGTACAEVAKLFSVKAVRSVTEKEMELLVQTSVFLGDKIKVKVLHQRFPYTNRIGFLGNYKDICFADLYHYGVYELNQEVVSYRLEQKLSEEEKKRICSVYSIERNRSVILAPYANTVSLLPDILWRRLAEALAEYGYTVFTNINGAEEVPIPTTRAIRMPISEICNVLNVAGCCIGLRSGFCDIISGCCCKKIVLYPDRLYQTRGSIYEFYSLKKMGIADDVTEYVFQEGQEETLFQAVLSNFKVLK